MNGTLSIEKCLRVYDDGQYALHETVHSLLFIVMWMKKENYKTNKLFISPVQLLCWQYFMMVFIFSFIEIINITILIIGFIIKAIKNLFCSNGKQCWFWILQRKQEKNEIQNQCDNYGLDIFFKSILYTYSSCHHWTVKKRRNVVFMQIEIVTWRFHFIQLVLKIHFFCRSTKKKVTKTSKQ